MRVCPSDQVSECLPTHSHMQFRVGWSDEGSFQSDKIRGYLFHESPGFWTLEYSMACTLFDDSQLQNMLSGLYMKQSTIPLYDLGVSVEASRSPVGSDEGMSV